MNIELRDEIIATRAELFGLRRQINITETKLRKLMGYEKDAIGDAVGTVRQAILDLLLTTQKPMASGTIARRVQASGPHVSVTLGHLVTDGYVRRPSWGHYEVTETYRAIDAQRQLTNRAQGLS